MDCSQNSFQLVWWCHQLLSAFLAKGHLPRVSRQSRRSLMIRVIMKWSGGCAQISWNLPYSWGKPRNPLSNYWLSRPELPLEILGYPNSSRSHTLAESSSSPGIESRTTSWKHHALNRVTTWTAHIWQWVEKPVSWPLWWRHMIRVNITICSFLSPGVARQIHISEYSNDLLFCGNNCVWLTCK